ncbi:hypothetical protein B5F10_02615 [Anaerotruncus colihominis]|uniref:DZANK-type domain-containing protein n=1 Tax=Anaerotruncus colihominis TaxID=169435 RepID=A0A1Y4MPL1_9FIRM|nr:zinc ribbon domain-containing protein [Anaerotruncus colihominis]OUP70613.1 hypothetical protein B5F11_04005 [Anaerotruncus colihominis]OUP76051.1 hypothetical protein B5F10_02615 [Anaerotruncus colihominis]
MRGLDIVEVDEPSGGGERVCPNCHREVTAGARFCSFCGSSIDGFIDYVSDRVLPKCPACGAEIDYGATSCEQCGATIEWRSNKDLLVGLDSLVEHQASPIKNKPRREVEYPKCTLKFNTFEYQLDPRGRRLELNGPYAPPKLQYNSFGIYSR